MRNKALLLVTLLMASGTVLAEQNVLESAGKQLLKDTATSAAPEEAVEGMDKASTALEEANKLKEGVKGAPEALKGQAQDIATDAAKQKLKEAVPEGTVEKAGKTLEEANKLKEGVKGAPEALKGQAQDIATESAKQKLKEAVPEEAKESVQTIQKGAKSAKKLKGRVPKSTGEATKAIEKKAKKEATEKAVDLLN